jgi:hypothetical protein
MPHDGHGGHGGRGGRNSGSGTDTMVSASLFMCTNILVGPSNSQPSNSQLQQMIASLQQRITTLGDRITTLETENEMTFRLSMIPHVVRVTYSAMYQTLNTSAGHVPKPKEKDTRAAFLLNNVERRGEIGFVLVKDYENFANEVITSTLKNSSQ